MSILITSTGPTACSSDVTVEGDCWDLQRPGAGGGVDERVLARIARLREVQRRMARIIADRDWVDGDVLQAVQLQIAEYVRG